MGHDIIATLPGTNQQIAHLRIGGADRTKTKLYNALDATDLNAVDSGIGQERTFTLPELQKARRSGDISISEDFFLDRCINNCSRDGIKIKFE